MASPIVSVIVSTYNQPRWLLKCLTGFAYQSLPGFELIIADDGSQDDTRRVVECFQPPSSMRLVHLWQADHGFRKCLILNKAIAAARSDYVVFTDGDCIPRRDFLATHLRLRSEGRFLSGGYVKLPMGPSTAICGMDIEDGRHADLAWLRSKGFRPGRQALKLTNNSTLAHVLDLISPARASWNGHNASAWKHDLLAVNGFDERMRYGGEDRELGERLENAGIRGKRIRFRAPVVHLDHERPYVDAQARAVNWTIRLGTRKEHRKWTDFGIDALRARDSADASTSASLAQFSGAPGSPLDGDWGRSTTSPPRHLR